MRKRRQPGRYKLPKAKQRSGARPGRWGAVLVVIGLTVVLVWQFRQEQSFARVPPLHRAALFLKQEWRNRVITHFSPPTTPKPATPSQPSQATPARTTASPPRPAEPPTRVPEPAPHATDPIPATGNRYASTTLEAQIVLMRQAISPGAVDGVMGSQTRAAVRAFQQREGLPVTGTLDASTRKRLRIDEPLFVEYVVTPADLARLEPVSSTWLGKSEQRALEFETVLELVSEQAKSRPALVRSLNGFVDWERVASGTRLRLPNTARQKPERSAAFVLIRLSERTLRAYDTRSNLLAMFPCSIGRIASKRPTGELQVEVRIPNPNYTFNPAIFPESSEGRELRRKLVIPPGPNNPVGTAWIGLDKPAYGIHGTPIPENVGRTESHGCFRLANWDAEYLLQLVWVGLPVVVVN